MHSIVGCLFYGAYAAKMLALRSRTLPGWALPVLGGTVLAGLALLWITAGAGVVGYVVTASSDATGTKPATAAANGYGSDEGTGTRLAALRDIPAGGGLIVAEAKVVLTRGESDEVAAFSATCTHQGCTVASIEDGLIVCPCHLSRFDLATGRPWPVRLGVRCRRWRSRYAATTSTRADPTPAEPAPA